MESIGKKVWVIPDAYYPEYSTKEPYISHEAICVLNIGDIDAELRITLYFEDSEPIGGFRAVCGGRRTNHIRLDRIVNEEGAGVVRGRPYAILLESAQKVVCQYSRLDTTQMQMSMITTMAY